MTFRNSPPSLPFTFSFLSFSPFCLWCLDIVLIVKQKIITIILPKRKARHKETEELAHCYAGNKEWWQDLNPGIVTAKPMCLYYTARLLTLVAALAGFQSQSYSVSAYCLLPPFPGWEPYVFPSYLGPTRKSPGYLLHCGWLEDLPLTASSAKGGQRGSGGKTQGRRLWCSEVWRSLCWEIHGSENVWALQALHDRKA